MPATSLDPIVTECVNADATDLLNPGCRGIFPNKTKAGLCTRCHLLKESIHDANLHESYKVMYQ